MSHFNQLTPAEAERLAMLAEECAEVIQIVGKILRHGYENHHPDDANRTRNSWHLTKELTDVIAVADAMRRENDIENLFDLMLVEASWQKKLRYSHHQEPRP